MKLKLLAVQYPCLSLLRQSPIRRKRNLEKDEPFKNLKPRPASVYRTHQQSSTLRYHWAPNLSITRGLSVLNLEFLSKFSLRGPEPAFQQLSRMNSHFPSRSLARLMLCKAMNAILGKRCLRESQLNVWIIFV